MASDNATFARQLQDGTAPVIDRADDGPIGAEERGAAPVSADTAPRPAPRKQPIAEEHWIDAERMAALQSEYPDVAQELKRRYREKADADRRLERMEQHMQSLQLTLANAATQPRQDQQQQKVGIEAYGDEELNAWKAKGEAVLMRSLETPDNEELRAEAQKYLASVGRVDAEIMRRKVDSRISGFRSELENKDRRSQIGAKAERIILRDLKDDGALLESRGEPNEVLNRARQHLSDLVGELGIQNADPETLAVAEVLAVKLAHMEQLPRGERDPRVTRTLDLAAQSSRVSGDSARRSAALARGDVDAVYRQDLDAFLRAQL